MMSTVTVIAYSASANARPNSIVKMVSINRMKSNNNNKRERKETKRSGGIFSVPSKFVLLFEK